MWLPEMCVLNNAQTALVVAAAKEAHRFDDSCSKYSEGERPNQDLNALEKVLGSSYPSCDAISVIEADELSIFSFAYCWRRSFRMSLKDVPSSLSSRCRVLVPRLRS